jgi:hypothetical protein
MHYKTESEKKDYGAQVNHNKHQHFIGENAHVTWRIYPNTNPNVEMHSALNMYQVRPSQTPNNFLGRSIIRPPPSSNRIFNPAPLNGVYDASQHIPILKTKLVPKQYH